MSNFYNDNPDLKHHLSHPLMRKIVEMKERNFSDAEKFDYAPLDYEDAMDSYEKVLEIAGEISGEIVAQNAEDVDHEGPHVVDGHVVYAQSLCQLMEKVEILLAANPIATSHNNWRVLDVDFRLCYMAVDD